MKPQQYYWDGTRSVPSAPEPLWVQIFGAIFMILFCLFLAFCLFSNY